MSKQSSEPIPTSDGKPRAGLTRPSLRYRNRIIRWTACTALIGVSCSATTPLESVSSRRAAQLHWQALCMDSDPLHGSVVYQPRSADARVTMVGPQSWQALEALLDMPAYFPPDNTLLVHGRQRPDRTRRLLVVKEGGGYNGLVPMRDCDIATLYGEVIILATRDHDGRASENRPPYNRLAKVALQPGDAMLPGSIDPADPTHFTVPIRRGQTIVTIDGRLTNDDTVVFRPEWTGWDR